MFAGVQWEGDSVSNKNMGSVTTHMVAGHTEHDAVPPAAMSSTVLLGFLNSLAQL